MSEVVPPNWTVSQVQDLFTVVGGGTPSTANVDYWRGNIAWISSADIDEEHRLSIRRRITESAIADSATTMVPAGSVIVVTRVGLGKVAIAPEPLCFSQDSQALLFNPKHLNHKYVLLFMSTVARTFRGVSRGTTISGITKKQLAELAFRVPPKTEQVRIVAEVEKQLTRLDDAVAALKRVRANLKRYRASVLNAACEGRLVPTEAELARKEGRNYESGEQLLARILRERRSRWEADQLAKVLAADRQPSSDGWQKKYKEPEVAGSSRNSALPEGWTWASVEQVSCSVQYGTSAKCAEAGEVPVLRMGNLTSDGLIVAGHLKFLPARHSEFPELLLSPGDLLFNRTNSAELVGKSAVYTGSLLSG
jgi:type I restriction enzyme S subunit